jgi:hypothetical protein
MLDVHMLVSPSTPRDTVIRSVSSIWKAIHAADFLIKLHILEGTEGHIGKGRRRGFNSGIYPYVTYVDDDDYVDVDHFRIMGDAMRNSVDAFFTRETVHFPCGESYVPRRRHCRGAFKRDLVHAFDWAAWPVVPEMAFQKRVESMVELRISDATRPTYHWYSDPQSKGKQLAKQYPEIVEKARRYG